MPGQTRDRRGGHAVPEVAEPEALEPPVENPLGVVHLAVAHEMDEVGGHDSSLRERRSLGRSPGMASTAHPSEPKRRERSPELAAG